MLKVHAIEMDAIYREENWSASINSKKSNSRRHQAHSCTVKKESESTLCVCVVFNGIKHVADRNITISFLQMQVVSSILSLESGSIETREMASVITYKHEGMCLRIEYKPNPYDLAQLCGLLK